MSAQSAPGAADAVVATEQWLVKHGLPYFVPRERKAAHDAMRPSRTVPLLAGVVLVAVAVTVVTLVLGDASVALGVQTFAATLSFLGLAAAAVYAVTALRARPIVTWAVQRTLGSLRQLLPMMTRALPLLIVFVTFLFLTGDVWYVASRLDGGVLWLVVLLFLGLGVGFFLVRLPEEIDRADDELDDARVVAVTRGLPVTAEAERLAAERPGALVGETQISRFERVNLSVALVVIQLSQALVVALSLLIFFMLFGALAIKNEVVEMWIQQPSHNVAWLPNVSVELLQVSVFLGAFSALYISVTAVSDEAYREQFFAGVMREMERAIAVRAAYNALRKDRGDVLEDDLSATPVEPLPSRGAIVAPDGPTVPLRPVSPDPAHDDDTRPE